MEELQVAGFLLVLLVTSKAQAPSAAVIYFLLNFVTVCHSRKNFPPTLCEYYTNRGTSTPDPHC